MDTDIEKMRITLMEDVSEDYYDGLYDMSVKLWEFYSNQFKDDEDFMWLRVCATRPAFHHLCFAYKATVYSCLIGRVIDNQIYIVAQDWDNNQRETKKYGLQPCIIPLEGNEEEKSINVLPLLDANTLEPIDFKSEHLNDPLSEWELYCMGVNAVQIGLQNNNCTDIQSCDIPSIKPSIWFTDSEGNPSYVIVRSVPIGRDEEPYTINQNLIDGYAAQGIKGYFANVTWLNLFGASGMYNEKEVFHSHIRSNDIPIEDIEDVEKNHKNIKFVRENIYNVEP